MVRTRRVAGGDVCGARRQQGSGHDAFTRRSPRRPHRGTSRFFAVGMNRPGVSGDSKS